jgi:hypothetical protein
MKMYKTGKFKIEISDDYITLILNGGISKRLDRGVTNEGEQCRWIKDQRDEMALFGHKEVAV